MARQILSYHHELRRSSERTNGHRWILDALARQDIHGSSATFRQFVDADELQVPMRHRRAALDAAAKVHQEVLAGSMKDFHHVPSRVEVRFGQNAALRFKVYIWLSIGYNSVTRFD